jgi:outer membrane protein OmpA-like peptidoglycan-associated protein
LGQFIKVFNDKKWVYYKMRLDKKRLNYFNPCYSLSLQEYVLKLLNHFFLSIIAFNSILYPQNVNKTSSTNRLRSDCLDCPPYERQPSSIWGLSLDLALGGSYMNFASHEAFNEGQRATFHGQTKTNFYGRISFEPLSFYIGDLTGHLSGEVTYRPKTPFPVREALLTHTEQFQVGVLGRVASKNISLGVGLDIRDDHIFALGKMNWSTSTEYAESRLWLRLQYRYTFSYYQRSKWFVGFECSRPLKHFSIDPYWYYRDYVINTQDIPLGSCYTVVNSEGSFPKGHFPVWDISAFGGYRFGRLPMWKKEDTGRARPVFYNALREQELRKRARDAAELERLMLMDAASFALAKRVVVVNESIDDTELSREAGLTESIGKIKSGGFESLLIHFATDSDVLTEASKEAVDRWVEQVWYGMKYQNVFQPNQLMIVGHCDARGSESHNKDLSWKRARSLSAYLRKKHEINVSSTIGFGTHYPLSEELSGNRYSWLVFAPDNKRNDFLDKAKIIVRGPVVSK